MGKKILVVDDEPHLVEILANRLKANRYRVATAATAQEGLEMAVREKPDLILLDILMPDMDGYQLLQKLKEGAETKMIPIMMLTVKKWSEDIQKAMLGGAVDYLVKPFDPVILIQKIRKALKDV